MPRRLRTFLTMVLLSPVGISWEARAEEAAPPSASFSVDQPPARQPPPAPAPAAPPAAPASVPVAPVEQAAAPGSAPVAPATAPEGVPARTRVPISCADHDAVFRAFSRYADTERRLRIGGAVGGVIAGAATIAMGVAFANYLDLPPEPFYILGGIAMVAPLAGLLTASSAESYARNVGAAEPGHSEAEALGLRQTWATLADSARSRRHWTAVGSFVTSAVSLGFGIAILDGAFTMTEDDRILWGSVLLGSSAAMAASGTTALLVLSPVEAAYEQFDAAVPLSTKPKVAVSGGPGGVRASLSLTF